MAAIGIAPAPAFEQSMRRRDPAQGGTARQIAAPVNHAAAELTNVERFSARVFTAGRAVPGPDAAHEQHARTVVALEIVDIGLKARGIAHADTGPRACFGTDDPRGIRVPADFRPLARDRNHDIAGPFYPLLMLRQFSRSNFGTMLANVRDQQRERANTRQAERGKGQMVPRAPAGTSLIVMHAF